MENIPEGLNYSENAPFHLSLFQGWMNLLNMAQKSVDIVSSHWDLNHSHPSACQVSCILSVCDDSTSVHLPRLHVSCLHFSSSGSLFQSTSPTHGTHTSSHSCVCALVDHVSAQLLLERQVFKTNSWFVCAYSRLSVDLDHFGGRCPHRSIR